MSSPLSFKIISKHFLFFLLLASLLSCTSNNKRFNQIATQTDFSSNKNVVEKLSGEDNPSADFEKSKSLKVASWNIRHLGRTKTPEDIYEIANILRDFDLVAIQEVVAKDPAGAQAVAKIADELNRMGAKWDYQISDPTKSPSVYMSERYAFLWKTSKVNLAPRAYLDKELEDICYREPFIGTCKLKEEITPFYVINYHGRKYYDKPEEEIAYFINYPERLGSNRVLITGDFNLDEAHDVWKPFYHKGFKSALQNQRTTLKTKCKNGNYLSHPIDNVYFTRGIKKIQAGSLDFIGTCKNLKKAREISDHLPIYIEFKMKENEK